jgi:integrase
MTLLGGATAAWPRAARAQQRERMRRIGVLTPFARTMWKRGRNGQRDACAILMAYRHGLRAAELCTLKWSQIDLRNGRLHVNRAKGGIESVHPLHGPELRALRPLQGNSPYVFITEAGTPVTTAWFLRMVQQTGKAAKVPFPVHPHNAEALHRVQARQSGRGHQIACALSWAQEPAIDGQIYGLGPGSI